jgi:hypothetical protein
MIERLQVMIKVYGYDEERDPDGQPVFAISVDSWEGAIMQVKEEHIVQRIPDFEISEKFGNGKFLYARIHFD